MNLFTPERAERLAATLETQDSLRVVRLARSQQPVIAVREHNKLLITTHVYARVWRGSNLRLQITYEKIHVDSVLL